MRHINIRAAKDSTEVDIFGQIGESFFEDGNTLESVKSAIEGVKTPITFNVASLGGSAFEGLAIHDLIKSHKQPTTVNVVGATASAGAIISVAADTVNISENSLFLVHKASNIAMGNVKDFEDAIVLLNQVDNRMKSIFSAKTGMDDSELDSLLDEDRFMDAGEALEKGFVDAIIKPAKIAASVDMKRVEASKELTDTQKEQLKTLNQIKTKMELSEDSKGWVKTAIENAIAAFKPEVKEPVSPEVNAEVTALEAKAVEANATIATLNAEIADLKAKVAAASAPEISINADVEPSPVDEPEVVDVWADTFNKINASLPAGLR